ncbi:hypothetical protein C481_11145 [Natrialba asiatica DSM 12278]|uniref:DNA primase/polymerase bifunctional N-terminal domain-containing protein n=2 Tax=Natrialba asiatica TaxID=64602 RepID=M0APY2_NATA1|nr:hypothetical protein C481_11145 [Natrialba asiatica DSM 12278]
MSATMQQQSRTSVETNDTIEIKEGAFTVPDSIRDEGCWICFRLEERTDGKTAKVPKNPRMPVKMHNCDPTDPDNGVTFEGAMDAVDVSQMELGDDGLDGVGLQLDGTPLVGIDLDDVVHDEEIDEWAWRLIDDFGSYSEISPSGTGVHVLVEGGLDGKLGHKNDNLGIEMYEHERYLTFTGRHISGTPETIEEAPEGLIGAHQRKHIGESSSATDDDVGNSDNTVGIDDDRTDVTHLDLTDRECEIVEAGCRYDDDFALLFEEGSTAWDSVKWSHDRSRADASLASKIAWWGQEADMIDFELDRAEIEHIFLASDLANRRKVKERPGYVRRTISAVI